MLDGYRFVGGNGADSKESRNRLSILPAFACLAESHRLFAISDDIRGLVEHFDVILCSSRASLQSIYRSHCRISNRYIDITRIDIDPTAVFPIDILTLPFVLI